MTITEFAILVFRSPPNLSDPTLQSLFRKLSAWQSECSGFPLRFFSCADSPLEIHLVTGWTSVAAHDAWIQGERNQELLRVFAPYVDMPRVRMVHLDVNFEAIPLKDAGWMIVERYDGRRCNESMVFERDRRGFVWVLAGRDLAREDGDVFRLVGGDSELEDGVSGSVAPVERWVLKKVEMDWIVSSLYR